MRETLGAIFGPFECGWRSKSVIQELQNLEPQCVLQGTLAECSDQAAIRQCLRLAGRLADLPPKTASQTSKNGGQPAIRLFKGVNATGFWEQAEVGGTLTEKGSCKVARPTSRQSAP